MPLMKMFPGLAALLWLTLASDSALAAETKPTAPANEVVEWSVVSAKPYRDPFNEVAVDFLVVTPGG